MIAAFCEAQFCTLFPAPASSGSFPGAPWCVRLKTSTHFFKTKVVYLDEDVVVKGDLLELFHVNMSLASEFSF